MADRVTRPARAVVRACAWLVPSERRHDWHRQWTADLAWQAAYLRARGRAGAAIRLTCSNAVSARCDMPSCSAAATGGHR